MTPSPMKLPLAAVAAASFALAAPAAAHAADTFVGITDGRDVVHFTTDTLPGVSKPVAVVGLPAGENLVALDKAPSGDLLAVGTTGKLYALDGDGGRVKGTVATLAGAIPAEAPTTLAVAADGATARVIAAGRDLTVDLASGALTRNEAAPSTALATALGKDGVLRGVNAADGTQVTLDGGGLHDLGALPVRLSGATAATTASDGTTWITTELARGAKAPEQSRFLTIDPAGVVHAKGAKLGTYLLRGLDAVAATGTVADDTAAPKVEVTIPPQTVRTALKAQGFTVRVRTSEAGQVVMSARAGGRLAMGLGFAEHAGTLDVVAHAKQSMIRAAAHGRVRIHLAIHDNSGHKTLVDRYLRLAR